MNKYIKTQDIYTIGEQDVKYYLLGRLAMSCKIGVNGLVYFATYKHRNFQRIQDIIEFILRTPIK